MCPRILIAVPTHNMHYNANLLEYSIDICTNFICVFGSDVIFSQIYFVKVSKDFRYDLLL